MSSTTTGTRSTEQLAAWQGPFGDAYTDRNRIDWRVRYEAFRAILADLAIRRVLEVGCNRGHNLAALAEWLGPEAEITGVEPNDHALELARRAPPRVKAVSGTAFDLPFEDGHFDLVFTSGVLIHVAPDDLPAALGEMHRTSRRYLLAIEYGAEVETMVPYRGRDDLLFKRDFPAAFTDRFADLRLSGSGEWNWSGEEATWWLMEKRQAGRDGGRG